MRPPVWWTAVKVLVVVAVAVMAAVPTALSTFVSSQREVQIGAHEAVVRPDFSGFVRLDFGPVLPRLRVPIDSPAGIGVQVRLGDSEVSDLEQLIARDAVIASQPQGELETIRSAVGSMAADAAARGAGVGLLVALTMVAVWRLVGHDRRQQVLRGWRRPGRRRVVAAVTAGAVGVTALVLVAAPDRPRETTVGWLPLRTVFPDVPDLDELRGVEVADTASAAGSKAIVEGALSTYRDSLEFYGKLADTASTVEGIREPAAGETTAIVVTDRHDNIGMDPVARAVADQAQASLLIDLGDDTSTGASWETFSLNSLAREFRGFDVVAVAGNHDTGDTVTDQMREKGFVVMDGEPVDVGGIRFIGSNDPRSSGLTAGYTGDEGDNIAAIKAQDAELTEAACADGDVAVAVVHSAASARELSRSGCVDLVLSGHLHRQVGPDVVESADGERTTTLTTGSTGGAVYAFALGSKLRRQAQVTVVTFRDGTPIGLQPVSFEPGGTISVADYSPIT